MQSLTPGISRRGTTMLRTVLSVSLVLILAGVGLELTAGTGQAAPHGGGHIGGFHGGAHLGGFRGGFHSPGFHHGFRPGAHYSVFGQRYPYYRYHGYWPYDDAYYSSLY